MMDQILRQLGLIGIIPVVVIEKERDAEALAQALLDGGLWTMEITLRTGAAQSAIARIVKSHPTMLVGAGTVLTVEQAAAAVEAGARYIVSPGLNRRVVDYCLSRQIPVTPGVLTPTEIEAALDLGITVAKFFPAEASGGIAYLKAVSAPYQRLSFIPTGGIDERNLLSYLSLPQVHACGGSWIVRADLITQNRFAEITQLTRQAVANMLGFVISRDSPRTAAAAASSLAASLRLPGPSNEPSTGRATRESTPSEQVAIGTHFIARAMAYLSRQGIGFREDTRVERCQRSRRYCS